MALARAKHGGRAVSSEFSRPLAIHVRLQTDTPFQDRELGELFDPIRFAFLGGLRRIFLSEFHAWRTGFPRSRVRRDLASRMGYRFLPSERSDRRIRSALSNRWAHRLVVLRLQRLQTGSISFEVVGIAISAAALLVQLGTYAHQLKTSKADVKRFEGRLKSLEKTLRRVADALEGESVEAAYRWMKSEWSREVLAKSQKKKRKPTPGGFSIVSGRQDLEVHLVRHDSDGRPTKVDSFQTSSWDLHQDFVARTSPSKTTPAADTSEE